MDLKKGLTFVAVGFLLTLVNLNLNFNDRAINVMPSFVGWFLMFLAFNKLGDYVSDRQYLKWISLLMVALTGVTYVMEFTKPGQTVNILQTVTPIISAVYTFFLLSALEKLAMDYKSPRGATLHIMKYMNLGMILVMEVAALLLLVVKSNRALVAISMVVIFLGIAALFVAIAIVVSLFRLRGDVSKQL